MALGCGSHLLLRAGDGLLIEIHLEPVILVPADEEPDVGLAVEAVLVDLAEDATRRHDVEQTDDYARVLTTEIAHRVRGIGEEALTGDDLDAGLLAARLQVLDRLCWDGEKDD